MRYARALYRLTRPVALFLALGLTAFAPDHAAAQAEAEGQLLFQFHCATCHGTSAVGNGPMAGVLLVQPTDLTALAAGNDGVFPTLRVVMRIDGRDPLVSHGSEMPVYGSFFEGDDTAIKAPTGQPILTSGAIADLVAYLKSVQVP